MAPQGIRAEKLTPHAGAVVHGVDLSKPLDEGTFKAIHDCLIDNCVIFFRDQHLTPDQQKDFGRRFGELHVHPAAPGLVEGHPEILVIHADETSKHVAGENWHSDVSCDPEPPMGSILYMHELPPVGGDTLFASMYAAYDALSEPMKRLLEDFTAMHEGEHVYRGRYGVKDEGKTFPKAEHPVIRTHPVSGQEGALREQRLHDAHRPAQAAGERRDAAVSLPPHRDAGVPVPLPLAGALHRVLGQPLRPAPRHVGLLPAAAARASRDGPGRQALLSRLGRATSRRLAGSLTRPAQAGSTRTRSARARRSAGCSARPPRGWRCTRPLRRVPPSAPPGRG